MELSKRNLVIIGAIVGTIGVLVVYNLLYAPLIRELKVEYAECKRWESDVSEVRNFIRSVEVSGATSSILTEKDISLAIDELTKHGKSKGINFVSITPKDALKKSQTQYNVIPIEIKIESTYKELGLFLGSLDEMEKSLVTVKSFKTTPYKEDDTKVLKTEMVIDMSFLQGK